VNALAVLTLVLSLGAATPTTPPPSSERSQIERDFVAANERALSGDQAGAITLYQSLKERGVVNEDLEFNLGNAFAETGRLVDAAVAYERALRLQPGHADARANLAAVRARLAPKEATPQSSAGPSQLADALEPLVSPFSAPLFGMILLGADALCFLLLLGRRYAKARPRRLLGYLLAVALLTAFASGLVIAGHAVLLADPRAVALSKQELKEGPHTRFAAQSQLFPGERVRVEREEAGWLEVKSTDGRSGWIPASAVIRI
jgi:hypothetical protein